MGGSFGVKKRINLGFSQIRSKQDQKGSNLTQSGIKVGLSWVNRCRCNWGQNGSNWVKSVAILINAHWFYKIPAIFVSLHLVHCYFDIQAILVRCYICPHAIFNTCYFVLVFKCPCSFVRFYFCSCSSVL